MMPRRGFTLVEMLVVLGLMILVAGIALGSLAGLKSGNRLVATQQLVTDLIHQARYTARSSGMPVVLRIRPTVNDTNRVNGGEISGLSQTTLWEEHFEDDAKWQAPGVLHGPPPSGIAQPVMGRTGHGLKIQGVPPSTTTVPVISSSLRLAFVNGDRSKRVVRSATAHDGFLLSASVHLPLVPATLDNVHIPVALIGGPTEPKMETALAGILIRQHVRPQQRMIPLDHATMQAGNAVLCVLATWEILGYARDASGTVQWLSSAADKDQSGSFMTKALNNDNTPDPLAKWGDFIGTCSPKIDLLSGSTLNWDDPVRVPPLTLIGERWVDVALMFDGKAITLLVDGAPVASRLMSSLFLAPSTAAVPDDRQDYLWVGSAILPNLANYPGADGSTWKVADYAGTSATILDDISLRRLGADTPTALPNGIAPYSPNSTDWFEITALPDGRCTASGLIFAETSDPAFDLNATAQPISGLKLTIDGNGNITPELFPVK